MVSIVLLLVIDIHWTGWYIYDWLMVIDKNRKSNKLLIVTHSTAVIYLTYPSSHGNGMGDVLCLISLYVLCPKFGHDLDWPGPITTAPTVTTFYI